MGGPLTHRAVASVRLPPDVRSVGQARAAVAEMLHGAWAADLLDRAQLAVSELVTNAVVHAGTELELRILTENNAVRVELADGSVHLPTPRAWSTTAGTGRGLHILDELVDRWDVEPAPDGKTVWFEIGQIFEPRTPREHIESTPHEDVVNVALLNVPLLMHWAWQEHAASLLREFLLYSLEDDPTALIRHAAASDALSVLQEQLPVPDLPADPDALMASSVEPDVTSEEETLQLRKVSVPHFAVLDDLLARAVSAAKDGHLLGSPTQPEIAEMRRWLCSEVAAQSSGAVSPQPWRPRNDVRVVVDEGPARARGPRALAASGDPLIAMDPAGVIVAVTPPLVRFLGYRQEDDLLGRRILVVIPARYHQAHIAGTTLHDTNGRDALLGRWIKAPVVRADGTETPVEFRVEPKRTEEDRRIFVATFRIG